MNGEAIHILGVPVEELAIIRISPKDRFYSLGLRSLLTLTGRSILNRNASTNATIWASTSEGIVSSLGMAVYLRSWVNPNHGSLFAAPIELIIHKY